ncbi:hypothetical protein TRICI_004716 [Trichomonascus ciferrii]|uniref:GAF domain-containing protein n=1 Tax=Trichomonascus ciferrii TaxID=44093 RepID=A0A642V085_9ASCO|nr:hypothetical protein TRICI_004716 [Trichomonascus ciferrii]
MQIVKHQSGLAMDVIARNVSIDGHALLSKDKMVLLDASNDWRMIYNPLVHGPPFIKFYIGVPLFSSDNQRIGVVAAFDPYARSSLPHNMDRYLMDISKKITQFLDSLPSALSPRIESAEATSPLDDECVPDEMYGRELGSFTQDGMPGLLPHNFDMKNGMNSLRRLNCNPELKQSYQIARELTQCISAKAAVERASRILADALGLSFVYVVEIRISSSYEVPAKYFPYSSGTPCKDIPQLDKILGPTIERNVHIRLLGGHGLSEGEEPKFDQEIHTYALDSTYGVQYDAPDEKVSFRSGIFMPFQKSESKVIHTAHHKTRKVFQEVRNTEAKTSKSEYKSFYTAGTDSFISTPDGLLEDIESPTESHKPQSPGSFNEYIFKKFAKMSIQPQKKPPSGPTKLIKTRHGGYILAGFSLLHRSFSPGDIEYMKLCVKGLDTIFASN